MQKGGKLPLAGTLIFKELWLIYKKETEKILVNN
jgi:hypothetical protein